MSKLSKSKVAPAKMSSGKSERGQMGVCIAQVRFHFSPTLFAPISSQIPLFPEFLARFALTDETVSAFIPPICALLKQTKLEIFRNIIFTVVVVNLCIFIKPIIWSGQGVCVGIGKFKFGSQVSNSCRYQAIGVEGGWERVTDFLLQFWKKIHKIPGGLFTN